MSWVYLAALWIFQVEFGWFPGLVFRSLELGKKIRVDQTAVLAV